MTLQVAELGNAWVVVLVELYRDYGIHVVASPVSKLLELSIGVSDEFLVRLGHLCLSHIAVYGHDRNRPAATRSVHSSAGGRCIGSLSIERRNANGAEPVALIRPLRGY